MILTAFCLGATFGVALGYLLGLRRASEEVAAMQRDLRDMRLGVEKALREVSK